MALFGVQLALSMIMASIISKIGGSLSLARYLLCNTGLIRYIHPTDDELKELAGIPKDKGKIKGKNDLKSPNIFHVPKHIDLHLDSVKVNSFEVTYLRYFSEYHWVFDYSVYATVIYALTEIYYGIIKPQDEMNLSVFWCLLTLGLCLNVLSSITAIYFRGDEVIGERAMCMVMGFVYLLISMMILIIDEEVLEVGIDPAYDSFQSKASAFLKAQGLPSAGPASKLIIKFVLACSSGILGAIFTFPGIRMSKMFHDSARIYKGRKLVRALMGLSYILPLIIVALWIRPIGRDVFTQRIGNMEPLMSDEMFNSMRLCLILLMVILRIALMPFFLQSFLNVAKDRIEQQKTEAGRILNTELQKKVTSIFYFLCVVALQYVAPCLVCLQLSFLYKTLGGGSWIGDSWSASATARDEEFKSLFPDSGDVRPATEHFTLALNSLKTVFNATVFRGLFCYATWWCVFLLFSSSTVGSVYISFLSHA